MSKVRKKVKPKVSPLLNRFDRLNETTLFVNHSIYENLVLSTRRIFHITVDESQDQGTNFKDIFFSDWGSGTLVKKGGNFFLLTARHVLKKYIEGDKTYINTSPFRITVQSNRNFSTTDDFLYPKRFWEIGKLIDEHKYYDFEDVVLVELFYPTSYQKVDHWIDLDKTSALDVQNFQENIILTDVGYSELSNPYHYESDNKEVPFDSNIHNCSTSIKRDMIKGKLKKDQFTYYFEKIDYLDVNTDGMSGGLIVGFHNNQVQPVGMHIRGDKSSNRINFLPINEIFKAIDRYEQAESIVIDYHHVERLVKGENLVSVGELFFNWALNQPEENLRSIQKDEDSALIDDMSDFIIENKEMLLSAAKDRDRILGTNNTLEHTKWFIDVHQAYMANKEK